MRTGSFRFLAIIGLTGLFAAGCSTSESEQVEDLRSELEEVTAERDELLAAADARQQRASKTVANQERVEELLADPASSVPNEEVLDMLVELTAPGTVMDDTAFGPVPIRTAWRSTMFGTADATIDTWVKWTAEDGSSGGSLWVWDGTAQNGEQFELIRVNLHTFDANGLVTYSLVDWPYPADYVKQAFATGNTP